MEIMQKYEDSIINVDLEIEKAVLGAILIESPALRDCLNIIKKPSVFYSPAHQKIFSTIQQMESKSESIDILTITAALRDNGDLESVGGAYYITELTSNVHSSAHIKKHSMILFEYAIKRFFYELGMTMISESQKFETSAPELIERFSGIEKNILGSVNTGNTHHIGEVLKERMLKLADDMKRKDSLPGIASGISTLDNIIGGWQSPDFIVIAARPGMGKTSFVLQIAGFAAEILKQPVGFLSLEMSNNQLAGRLMAYKSEVSIRNIKLGKVTPQEIQQISHKASSLCDAPLFVDDTSGLDISEIRAKAYSLKQNYDIKMLIVDYLQLASGDSKSRNRVDEVTTISRGLKYIAKELDIPVIALSQLSRGVESRPDKKPNMSDLRDSGAIEQDADIIMFLYRPEYYGFNTLRLSNEEGGEEIPAKGICEIIISKHRDGDTKSLWLNYKPDINLFKDYSIINSPF